MEKNAQLTKSFKPFDYCRQTILDDFLFGKDGFFLENVLYFGREAHTIKREKVTFKWELSAFGTKAVGAVVKEISSIQTKLLVANSINNGIFQTEKTV